MTKYIKFQTGYGLEAGSAMLNLEDVLSVERVGSVLRVLFKNDSIYKYSFKNPLEAKKVLERIWEIQTATEHMFDSYQKEK